MSPGTQALKLRVTWEVGSDRSLLKTRSHTHHTELWGQRAAALGARTSGPVAMECYQSNGKVVANVVANVMANIMANVLAN